MPGPTRRRGLTLIELLVVLTILVILTTIAITSTSQVVDQGRYDATQRTLQNIQDAIIGPANQRAADGSLLITGFVADMGRLPQLFDAASDPLRELWDSSVIPPPSAYALQPTPSILNYAKVGTPSLFYPASPPPTGYTTFNNTTSNVAVAVSLACGWRGPYLTLPVGSGGRLLDSWGKPFDSMSQALLPSYTLNDAYGLSPSGTLTVGQQINIVRSLGADNQPDTASSLSASSYNQDQYVPAQVAALPPLPTATTPLVSFSVTGSVTIVVQSFNTATGPSGPFKYLSDPVPVGASDAVEIVLFTPVNGVLTPIYGANPSPAVGVLNANYFPLAATTGTPTPNVTCTFTNVAIGPRAVQAFQFDIGSGYVSRRSPLVYLTVPSGGVPSQTLILQ